MHILVCWAFGGERAIQYFYWGEVEGTPLYSLTPQPELSAITF